MIDHSLLYLTMTDQELDEGCRLSATYGVASVQGLKVGTITITTHGAGGKRFIGVPAGQWQAQHQPLTWNAAARKWTLDHSGCGPGEALPTTVVLKAVQL